MWKAAMRESPPLSARIEAWTREAVLTWGDDWARISEYIELRMSSLDPQDERDVAEETALTLIGTDEDAQH
jgi:hypothetical protein